MPETVPVDGPPVAKGATASASARVLHFDSSRAYIGKIETEGVIRRQADGFQLAQSRVANLRSLRRERRQSPLSEADADDGKAETALLRLRIA